MNSIRCQKCGTPNREGARFCAQCRAPLPMPVPATQKTCPTCNQPNRMDARFCASCGHVFSAPPARTLMPQAWLGWRVHGIPALGLGAAAGTLLLFLCGGAFAVFGNRSFAQATPTTRLVVSRDASATPNPTEPSTLTIPPATATIAPSVPPSPVPPTAPPATPTFAADLARERALRATVQIIVPLDGSSGDSVSGSGTVITRRGYILTNNHLFYDDNNQPFNSKFLAYVAFPPRNHIEGSAQIQYQAVLVEDDPARDLALIRITALNNDGALPSDLGLDVIPIGDSETVELGHILTIVGYPGIGGDSLTLTTGNVSGFIESADWIKTDAEINQGNSGGPALNARYELIGVVSAASQSRQLVGKLGLIRPIRFALALIERARRESGE